MPLYEICLAGNPDATTLAEIKEAISKALACQSKTLGKDVGWHVKPTSFDPAESVASVVLFFGGTDHDISSFANVRARGVPCIPVVTDLKDVTTQLPASLAQLNSLGFVETGATRIASALMESLGLLPKQRRVFVSYRRTEAREAAVQLFDVLSGKLFDVFLDTHGVAPGDDFQSVLWHRLCDCDVLVMLDTATYFESRWTAAEFGRALAKGISILRVAWPAVPCSSHAATTYSHDLDTSEINSNGSISDGALQSIWTKIEEMRSLSFAVRSLNMFSTIESGIRTIGGTVKGTGLLNSIEVELFGGRPVLIIPAVGVPTSANLHIAEDAAAGRPVVVVYDHVGILPSWQKHLEWLGERISTVRWVKASEVAWQLADMGVA